MPAHLIDSAIFKDMFGTSRMRSIFSDDALIQRWLDVEAALARTQARLGIIPKPAAAVISQRALRSNIDVDLLKRETELVGYPILPLVHQLARTCGDAGEYVHWGATTQDIMDTAVVLQMQAAFAALEEDLAELQATMAGLATRYRDTPMPGRTHGQHAFPITFGYKVAVWLAEVHRHHQRLHELRERVLVGQFGGAVGTLSALGTQGLEVQALLMKELRLGQPLIAWHVARDTIAETTALLGLITATVGKVAGEVARLMTTEIGEVSEPFTPGRGGSSTMPQKRNPISCEAVTAIARIVRQHVGLALDTMVQDHERGTGPWLAEWEFLPEAFILTAGALGHTRGLLAGLTADRERMQQNLALTRGLIMAEAVMMALAPWIGRQRAHDLVYQACIRATERAAPLLDVLREDPDVRVHLSEDVLQKLFDPSGHTGLAAVFVDRVVDAVQGVHAVQEAGGK